LKKILIISYFFPPCNLTASQRAYNWAKHLKDFGYDPIVITRRWDTSIQFLGDECISSSSTEVIEEVNERFKVFYMPYIGSLRDRIFMKNRESKKILRKALSFKEQFCQNFFINSLPYSNMYHKAVELIEIGNISSVIITGSPFESFHFGYELKRKYPHINWVADYRDDWTTTELFQKGKGLERVLFKLAKKSEKKWLNSAQFFTTISSRYVDKISHFTGVKGYEIINGFGTDLAEINTEPKKTNEFHITYNGTLYPSQNIEPILRVIKDVIFEFKDQLEIHLNFPGLSFTKEAEERVRTELKGLERIHITERISREEVIKIQQNSHLMLMVAHEGIKGVPSSKLYEYIGLNKPVLLFPNDHDIIEETLLDTGLGVICNSENEIKEKLTLVIENFIKNGKVGIDGDPQQIQKYSRRNGTNQLAKLLDGIDH
jgi:glycosyltransferase involved in cell wall biosynthesis